MSKEATPITVQVVTFNTTLPYKEVVARLEGELNKAESPDTFARFLNAKSNKEWLSVLDKRAQGRDFQYDLPCALVILNSQSASQVFFRAALQQAYEIWRPRRSREDRHDRLCLRQSRLCEGNHKT